MRYILLGDTHFFSKKSSLEFFENQIRFFEQQLFPYMLENNINNIIQVGDVLDNRTSIDINLLSILRSRFFDKLVQYNFKIITILGNHDIYFKNTRDVNFMSVLQELYPDNIDLIQQQTKISINNVDVGFIPFLTPEEPIDDYIISTSEYLFGHFETQGFEIAKGSYDTHSELTVGSFKQYKNLKGVFSGHYHIKNTEGFVKYLGTPYSGTWSDYGNECGFYVMNEDFDIEFIENNISYKYYKMVFDGNFYIDSIKYSIEKLNNFCLLYKNSIIKFYLFNISLDNTDYEEYLTILKNNSMNFSIVDNREEENTLVQQENANTSEVAKTVNLKNTDIFIHDFIKENYIELYPLFLELINE